MAFFRATAWDTFQAAAGGSGFANHSISRRDLGDGDRTESPELVMRRGRWMAHRTMDVYLQELNATVFFPRLPSSVKERVLELAHSFPALLASLEVLMHSKVAPELWYAILTKKGTDGKDGRYGPGRGAESKALHRERNKPG